MPQWKLFIIEMSGKMSEKILSRKWDVWQERLGWEGNSHLLGKMCPESVLGKDIQLTAGLSLSDVIRWWECTECVGQFCLTKDFICVTARGGPRSWHQATGQAQDDDYKLSESSDLWNESQCLAGKLIVLSKKCELETSDRRLITGNWLFAGLRGFMRGQHLADASKYQDPAPGWRQTFDPGRSLMFIWPTDGVIASMISTQTKMTDSEYSPQLFTHCLVNSLYWPPSNKKFSLQ